MPPCFYLTLSLRWSTWSYSVNAALDRIWPLWPVLHLNLNFNLIQTDLFSTRWLIDSLFINPFTFCLFYHLYKLRKSRLFGWWMWCRVFKRVYMPTSCIIYSVYPFIIFIRANEYFWVSALKKTSIKLFDSIAILTLATGSSKRMMSIVFINSNFEQTSMTSCRKIRAFN